MMKLRNSSLRKCISFFSSVHTFGAGALSCRNGARKRLVQKVKLIDTSYGGDVCDGFGFLLSN